MSTFWGTDQFFHLALSDQIRTLAYVRVNNIERVQTWLGLLIDTLEHKVAQEASLAQLAAARDDLRTLATTAGLSTYVYKLELIALLKHAKDVYAKFFNQ